MVNINIEFVKNLLAMRKNASHRNQIDDQLNVGDKAARAKKTHGRN